MATPRSFGVRSTVLASVAFGLGMFAAGHGALEAAWQPVARAIGLTDPPVPSSANVLSEHETDALDGMTPQAQAELLLERAINHYQGASEQIAARVRGWRGRIELNGRLDSLFMTAINSSDLTVRVAGVEVDIAARGLVKSAETLERLEPIAREGAQGVRVNAMWDLALLGNRGLEPERVFDILMASIHDDNQNIRYWAVEGLAFLATTPPSSRCSRCSTMTRWRRCGSAPRVVLAQSGMFSAEQRRRAVPRFLDYANDPSLDDQTRGWVFQALRDITGQSLPQDAAAWREWYQRTRRR
jgi:hypothetical protein